MPIYEYRCSACGHELEALQKLSDAKLLTCPVCHADALVKKVSAAGFQLKGSGWYVTDFRNGNKGGAAKKDAAPATGDAKAAADSGSSTADSGGESGKSESAKSESTAAATPAAKSESSTPAASAAPAAASTPAKPSSSST